jgi:hypothetical protein
MTTPTLDVSAAPLDTAPPSVASGSTLGRGLRWALSWLWSLAVGAVFCLSLVTGLIVLGWFARWMRGRVLRGLYRVSPRRQEATLAEVCADLGEREPGRPHWFLRDGSSEKPQSRSLLNLLLWPVWGLGTNLKLGLKLALGTWLTLGWACALLFFAWEYGWEISFNKQYERSPVGASTTLIGISLLVLMLPYVLLAQVHLAITGELKSMLDYRLIRKMIRVSLWPLLLIAVLLLGTGTIFEGLKSGGRLAMGQHLGSEPTAAEIRELQKFMQAYFFWSCVGLMVTLVVLKGLTAWIYRRALVKLLASGEVQPGDLPPVLTRWVIGLRLLPLPGKVARPTWRVPRFLGRSALRVALFVVLFLFTFRTHVGVFLTYDPNLSSSFLNQPLVQVPWFNFTPENLEELAQAAEAAEAERP